MIYFSVSFYVLYVTCVITDELDMIPNSVDLEKCSHGSKRLHNCKSKCCYNKFTLCLYGSWWISCCIRKNEFHNQRNGCFCRLIKFRNAFGLIFLYIIYIYTHYHLPLALIYTNWMGFLGVHTIGYIKCLFVLTRIYNESNIDPSYARALQASVP